MAAQGGSGMNNLTTLIKRLEAATSRLEDIASSSQPSDGGSSVQSPAPAAAAKLAAGVPDKTDIPRTESQSSARTASPNLPPAINDMDALIQKEVQTFIESSKSIDPLVKEQAQAVAKGFADQRRFLIITTKAKKPDPQSQTLMALLKDLQQDLGTAGDIKDGNRGSPMKEHLAMVAEGISTLQWLLMEGKPADVVGEIIGGAQMYGNRVLKAYKDGDQNHVQFVRSYYALLKGLQAYIRKHYQKGVTWNANGMDAAQAMKEVDEAPTPSQTPTPTPTTNGVSSPPPGGAAPPPPPPPLPNFDNEPARSPTPSGGASGGGDMGSVFEQLNRGEAVTSGLKKVDQSEMTHKNPALRAGSAVPEKGANDISRSRSPGPEIKPKPAAMRQNSGNSSSATATVIKKEGKKELDGNKWLIENYDSPSSPIKIDVTLSQSVLISRCKNTTVLLKGKANAVSIDNSPRTQILVDTLVSSVDVIKSPNFAIQITGTLPTIMLDQVDNASIYLSVDSLATEVYTSKCSSVNIILPPEDEEGEGDSKECPLPEQIRTYVKNGRIVSEIVEHAG